MLPKFIERPLENNEIAILLDNLNLFVPQAPILKAQ